MELGSTVKLAFKGTLDDGTVFGYATAENPMEFQTGMDLVVDGFEREILAMNEVGEKKTFTISEYDAYVEYLDDFVQKIPIDQIPISGIVPGKRVKMHSSEGGGQAVEATVVSIEDGIVTFDMNHPLAGQKLTYEVEILGLEDAPENFVSHAEKMEHLKQQTKLLGGDQGDDYR